MEEAAQADAARERAKRAESGFIQGIDYNLLGSGQQNFVPTPICLPRYDPNEGPRLGIDAWLPGLSCFPKG